MDNIFARRSVRKYLPDALPREALEQIVAAGKAAPSAMNKQPYHITVVTAPEKLALLDDLCRREMLSNPNLPPHVRERVDSPDFTARYNAPCLILVCAEGPDRNFIRDADLVMTTMLLAARALDIGSCWLGAFSFLTNIDGAPELLARELGIPEGYALCEGACFGYPDGGFGEARERRTDNVNWVE